MLLVQGEGRVTAALGLSPVLKDILSSQVSLTTVISFFPQSLTVGILEVDLHTVGTQYFLGKAKALLQFDPVDLYRSPIPFLQWHLCVALPQGT